MAITDPAALRDLANQVQNAASRSLTRFAKGLVAEAIAELDQAEALLLSRHDAAPAPGGLQPGDPALQCFTITPGDTKLDPIPKAIRASGTGTITLRAVGSDKDVAHPVIAGERIDVFCAFVRAATGQDGPIIGYL